MVVDVRILKQKNVHVSYFNQKIELLQYHKLLLQIEFTKNKLFLKFILLFPRINIATLSTMHNMGITTAIISYTGRNWPPGQKLK